MIKKKTCTFFRIELMNSFIPIFEARKKVLYHSTLLHMNIHMYRFCKKCKGIHKFCINARERIDFAQHAWE